MMPAVSYPLGSGACGTQAVFDQPYSDIFNKLSQQHNKYLRRLFANMSAPGKVSNIAYETGQGFLQSMQSSKGIEEIDFASAEVAMKKLAKEQGLDFDRIVENVSLHFRNSDFSATRNKLTDDDINRLVEDDDQALDS